MKTISHDTVITYHILYIIYLKINSQHKVVFLHIMKSDIIPPGGWICKMNCTGKTSMCVLYIFKLLLCNIYLHISYFRFGKAKLLLPRIYIFIL